ncbi:ABC transporter substrate-binding protein [Pseudoruegeria sp. HB172150]|uniref:ABC transporter substrate-binding protein n=1 Tax=Pseudoruegeria sp. HB172150 TaxID=2721164 RepID=UPI001552C666|nr:ABC transporter substrate-binding protein [Pseudoruegeria sp. HB172150]
MARLQISIASWDYDRVRPLMDGRVGVEGCEVNYLPMPVEECFHRAYFHSEFDVTEIGMSPFLIACSRGLTDYMALPVFLSRMFRHSAIYVSRDSGIDTPEDLRGKRVGVPEYQMSAALWSRGMLKDDFGIVADDMSWVQGGLEQPGRRDKFPLNLPNGFPIEAAPAQATLSQMLGDGALDAVISARAPSSFLDGSGRVRRLFPDYRQDEAEYYRRTGIFPIMHAVGIRKSLVERHPWLPASLCKAFAGAKAIAEQDLGEVTALKIGLPWVAAEYEHTVRVMGRDFWSYGIEPNRKTLEAMMRYSHEQGLATRRLALEEVFAESTMEDVSV